VVLWGYEHTLKEKALNRRGNIMNGLQKLAKRSAEERRKPGIPVGVIASILGTHVGASIGGLLSKAPDKRYARVLGALLGSLPGLGVAVASQNIKK
jgi:hypothetical protein